MTKRIDKTTETDWEYFISSWHELKVTTSTIGKTLCDGERFFTKNDREVIRLHDRLTKQVERIDMDLREIAQAHPRCKVELAFRPERTEAWSRLHELDAMTVGADEWWTALGRECQEAQDQFMCLIVALSAHALGTSHPLTGRLVTAESNLKSLRSKLDGIAYYCADHNDRFYLSREDSVGYADARHRAFNSHKFQTRFEPRHVLQRSRSVR